MRTGPQCGLGRATDPEEGGALGVAIVEHFRSAGAFTLVSTHLLALKIYGANTEGVYECRACGAELFRSDTKFESHCGWPSFFDPKDTDAVILREDRSMGMVRVEVLCATCHSHLGHLFQGEGYPTPTDQRYCINSISLRLVPKD